MIVRSVFLVSVAFVCVGCTQADMQETSTMTPDADVRLYASIAFRETPYAKMKGLIKITTEEAQKRGHYRFVHDAKERIVEISFRQGARYKQTNHTADSYQFPSTIVRMEYQGNREITSFFNRANTQIAVRGSVFHEVYELDDRGNRKSMFFQNEEGNKIENNWDVARYTWELHDDGSVVEERFNLNGEPQPLRPYFPFYRIRLHYDSHGYISLMQNIDADGNLLENETGVAQDKIEFDSEGRWLGWRVLDKNGNLTEGNGPNVARGINTPTPFGYEAAVRYEDRHGKPLRNSHGFWGSKRFYDTFGNMSHAVFTDSLGQPAPNEITGYTYLMYEWDDSGMHRVVMRLLDANKRPIRHAIKGYSVIRFEYDTDGNPWRTSYFDENESLANRIDNGVAVVEYEYDTDQRRTKTTHFDERGQELDKQNDR